MDNKTAILIRVASEDPRFAEQKSIIMSELHSAMAVPLFDEGRVLGILYADTANPMHVYQDEDLHVLATFGNLIASRLLNYQLLSERESKQIMEAELKRASMIQEALLVPKPPKIAGYDICPRLEQSRLAGGDLYDMHRFDDGRLFFMVADVSGKGMGAALLMSHILASFRILYEALEFDLVRAVQRVSSQMFRHSDPSDFATLFAGILDPTTHEVRFVNAGHNSPRLVRSDGDIALLEPSGIVIGSFDQANWQESMVRMSKGDTLYIFTDGVCEAQGDSRFYGYERMEKLLVENRRKSAVDITQCIMNDVTQYMGDAPRSDDITMLTIKRTAT
jgi:sigma-B regulation protein RsbU (phosphoserine phosphatase)